MDQNATAQANKGNNRVLGAIAGALFFATLGAIFLAITCWVAGADQIELVELVIAGVMLGGTWSVMAGAVLGAKWGVSAVLSVILDAKGKT
jgi:hypothetical protein